MEFFLISLHMLLHVMNFRDRPIGRVIEVIAFGAVGVWFDSRLVNRTLCCQRVATAATFLRSCNAQALSRGNGPRHSSQLLA